MTHDTKYKELQRELFFLYRVARTVHSLELNELLKEIVSITYKVTQGDSILIYTRDNETNELILRASKNPHHTLLNKIKMKLGEGITGWVAREKKAVVISENASQDPRFKFFSKLPEDTFQAFLSVPIVNKTGVVGVINVQHKQKHKHLKTEVNLLTAIGKLVGGAVENALLIAETSLLKEALELRKTLDKAKGILMKRKNISEDQAYKMLRTESMRTRKSLKDLAEAVLLAEKLKLNA